MKANGTYDQDAPQPTEGIPTMKKSPIPRLEGTEIVLFSKWDSIAFAVAIVMMHVFLCVLIGVILRA